MTEVKTDIYVTSFGPVSDADMVKYCFLSLITYYVLILCMSLCIIPLSHILSPCLCHWCLFIALISATCLKAVSQALSSFKIFRIKQTRGYHENEVLTVLFICFLFYPHWCALTLLYFDIVNKVGGHLSYETSIIPPPFYSVVYFS